MTRYILSSVGTSLLTNNAGHLTTLLRDTANFREAELSAEQRHALDERIAAVRSLLSAANLAQRRRCSAELNGLHGLCGERLIADDLHFLLATDTYQGRAHLGLLPRRPQGQGVSSVQVVVPGSALYPLPG